MLRSVKMQIKTRCTALLLILCLLLAGCGKQDAKDTAAQGETTEIFSSYTISPSGVLRSSSNYYLLFYDKESDSTVYLCNRAGCRHIDHDCGAYFENLYSAFFYHDSLYAVTILSLETESCEIFRANRYGENRELLAAISMPVLQMEIVGNEFYFFAPIMEKIDDNASHSVGQLLCRLNLDTGDYREFPAIDTGYPNASPGHFTITENFIYLNYTASSVDFSDFFDYQTGELKDITWDEIVYTDLLYRVDRNTEDAELIYMRESMGGVSGLSVLEEREHSLILSCSDRIWEYDPQTGAETVLYAPADETSQLTEIYPLGEYNMVCDYKNSRFILLKDWQETGFLSMTEHEVDTFFGKCGDTVYFGRWGQLCAIAYDDLINGVYDFTLINL